MRVSDVWSAMDRRYRLVVCDDGRYLGVVDNEPGDGEVNIDDIGDSVIESVRPDSVAGFGNCLVAVLVRAIHEYDVSWNNGGRYANFSVRAHDHHELWAAIRSRINADLVMSVRMIH